MSKINVASHWNFNGIAFVFGVQELCFRTETVISKLVDMKRRHTWSIQPSPNFYTPPVEEKIFDPQQIYRRFKNSIYSNYIEKWGKINYNIYKHEASQVKQRCTQKRFLSKYPYCLNIKLIWLKESQWKLRYRLNFKVEATLKRKLN